MKVLSLFSGVGGFDLGLERAGMQTVFQCEWDKHATRILERHWPDVPRWDDVSTLTGKHILQHAPVIDIVAWGSPCQDLSVAGKRAGLDGSRSGLFHEGIRIIKELQEETNGKYPRISLWENVYGALSSNKGADFGVILDEMAEAGALVQEWRVLDAQYFGVPQRRRRVFLVSIFDSATAARCPNPLLPVSQSVRRDTETSGTERQEPTGTTPEGVASRGHRMRGFGDYTDDDTASAIKARDHKDATDLIVDNPILIDRAAFNQGTNAQYNTHISDDPITPSLVARGPHAVATFTKAKRAQSTTDNETWVEGKPAPTLNAFDQGDTRATTVIAFENSYRDGIRIAKHNVSQTLSAKMGTGGNNTPMVAQEAIMFDTTYSGQFSMAADASIATLKVKGTPGVAIPIQDGRDIEKHQNGLGIGEEGAPSYTLDQTGAQAVAYGIQGTVIGRQDHNGPGGKGHTDEGDPMYTLTSTDIHAIATTMAVRRLTPIECERLMGWPDNWTEGQADTHRYKQCGNGVASPVATWIAQHLQQLDKDTNATPTQTPTT